MKLWLKISQGLAALLLSAAALSLLLLPEHLSSDWQQRPSLRLPDSFWRLPTKLNGTENVAAALENSLTDLPNQSMKWGR